MISAFCNTCGKFHELDSLKAKEKALQLLKEILTSGKLAETSDTLPADSFSTSHLYGNTGGKMFGVLLCKDESGNEIILKAFSGKFNNHRSIPGWVPHLFDEQKFEAVISEGNALIHPLTSAIHSETDPEKRKQLAAERKAVSHPILKKLYDLYEVHNFNWEKKSLYEAFSGSGSIPTGTGDCCAPKLLNFAAKNNLKPISLAEFYMGKPLKNSDKGEGQFYKPCKEKCGPLLGFMLCGLQ